jgi:hypothetical protein
LITGVETTFNEVTVDSPSFKWKNELELGGRCAFSAARARQTSTFGTLRRPRYSVSHKNHLFRELRPRSNPHRLRPGPRGSVQRIVSEVPKTPVVRAGLAVRHFRYNPPLYGIRTGAACEQPVACRQLRQGYRSVSLSAAERRVRPRPTCGGANDWCFRRWEQGGAGHCRIESALRQSSCDVSGAKA